MAVSELKVGKGINVQVLADVIDPILRRFANPFSPYIVGNSLQIDTGVVADPSDPNKRYWHRVLAEITRNGQAVTIKVYTVPANGSVDPNVPRAIRDSIETSIRRL
jgi:hypothetical protein